MARITFFVVVLVVVDGFVPPTLPRTATRLEAKTLKEAMKEPKKKRSVWGGLRRVLFRKKPTGEEPPQAKGSLALKEMSPGEELTTLAGLPPREEIPHNAEEELYRRYTILDAPDPTDEELWKMAEREVKETERFAKNLPLTSEDEPRMSQKEIDEALRYSWPDLTKFTTMLKAEALFRLRILGPSFAEPLKSESRWRRGAYKAFLEFIDGPGIFPDTWPTEFVPPMNDKVRKVFFELQSRRHDLRAARDQFDRWETKAAARALVPLHNALPPAPKNKTKRWWWANTHGPPAALPPPPFVNNS